MKYTKEIGDKFIGLYETGDQSIQAICTELKISRKTYYNWKNNKSFAKKLEDAHTTRLAAIGDMALSGLVLLLSKHEYEEVKTEFGLSKDGKPIKKSETKTTKFTMPNPSMVALALTNRYPKDWKQRQSIEHTGKNDGPIETETVFKVGYGNNQDDEEPEDQDTK